MEIQITQNGIVLQPKENTIDSVASHTVYEVIRVIDGIPLFLEDHFKRLISSIQISGLELDMGFSEFRQHILQLSKLNQRFNGNVRFVLSETNGFLKWSFSFIPHSYPTSKDYEKGVATGSLFIERQNPNAKVVQNTVRSSANELIATNQLYEVLLVDNKGLITEGSRSNVFFIKENKFYTAPAAAVLLGITRIKVLECLKELNYTVIEVAIPVSEVNTYDAVFLTGTSPKILPINCIDDVPFSVKNPPMEQVMALYDAKIEAYLRSHKR